VVPSHLQMGSHGTQLTLKHPVLNVKIIGGLSSLRIFQISKSCCKATGRGETLTFSALLVI
jgi:hypothetical protein